jgi:soluble lytic murein transglycosylase-like protein
MRLAIAGAFAGAITAILLTRGKIPGTVQAVIISQDGSQETVSVEPDNSLPLPDGATIDLHLTQTAMPTPLREFGVVDTVVEKVTETVKDTVAAVSSVFGTKYDSLIHTSAVENGLPPETLYKLLYEESHFRDDIITGKKRSSTGAMGIAQFMPATAREWLGSEAAALDPRQAIPGAARYLAWLRRQFGGDLIAAVAAYNWGIGNVKKKGLARAPAETQNYVSAITGASIA